MGKQSNQSLDLADLDLQGVAWSEVSSENDLYDIAPAGTALSYRDSSGRGGCDGGPCDTGGMSWCCLNCH